MQSNLLFKKIITFLELKKYSNELIILAITIFLFLFLRVYKLPSSLLFFNDMGRDFYVLQTWYLTNKPPLLGPQTSALSYNQSAWYFYIIFPIYYLTQSPYSSVITLLIFSIVLIGTVAYFIYKNKNLLHVYLAVLFLITIHPQVIIQNRFIWNPSFLPILLASAIILFLKVTEKFSKLEYFLFIFLLAFASGFSYSAVPLAGILWILSLILSKNNWKVILFYSFIAGFTVLLPTVVFEMRHDFALTKLAIHGQTTPQVGTDWHSKTLGLQQYILSNPFTKYQILVQCVTTLLILSGFWIFYFKQKADKKISNQIMILLIATLFITYLLPVTMQSHYIFPLLVLFFYVIAVLPLKPKILLFILFSYLWLQPVILQSYFKPAVRTISQLEKCYENYCKQQKQPLYVSMESGILAGYHNAPEHRFFLSRAGCQVLDIEEDQNKSNLMAVINDNSTFDPGLEGYHELSLFGPYITDATFACTDHLSILEIRKASDSSQSGKIKYTPQ